MLTLRKLDFSDKNSIARLEREDLLRRFSPFGESGRDIGGWMMILRWEPSGCHECGEQQMRGNVYELCRR